MSPTPDADPSVDDPRGQPADRSTPGGVFATGEADDRPLVDDLDDLRVDDEHDGLAAGPGDEDDRDPDDDDVDLRAADPGLADDRDLAGGDGDDDLDDHDEWDDLDEWDDEIIDLTDGDPTSDEPLVDPDPTDDGPLGDDSVLERVRGAVTGTITGGVTSIITGPVRGVARPEVDPIRRHRAEYREPAIWVWRRIVGVAFAFIVVTLAWYLVKIPDGLIDDGTLPSQTQVATAFNELRTEGFAGAALVDHIAASLARLVIGALAGVGLGILLGLAIGSAPIGRTVADPIVSLLGMVPAVAVGPLAIAWLGPGEAGIVGTVAATVLWAATDVVATVRLRDLRGLRPDIAHELVAGWRRVLAAGWASVLAMETLLAPIGLGPMLWSAQQRIDVVIAGIYLVGLVGLTIDAIPRLIEYLVSNGSPADRRAVRARHPAAARRGRHPGGGPVAVRGGSVAGSG